MKVRLLGFTSEITETANPSRITMDSFMEYLVTDQKAATEAGEESVTKIGEHGRLLYIDKETNPSYYLGLAITVKDQKKFCELTQNGKNFTIKVTDLENKMMDFNFFVLNKTTGTGLYQHYHQSCSLNSLFHILSSKLSQFRGALFESEVNNKNIIGTNSEIRKIKAKLRGRIKSSILVKKENLEKLIASLKEIKSFEYEYSYLDIQEPEFKPISSSVKRESKKLIFTPDAVEQISRALGKFVNNNDLEKGKVIGSDDSGNERIYHIMNNPDNFGELDYDDIADKLNELDISNFQTSWPITELLKTCAKYKHIFETKAN